MASKEGFGGLALILECAIVKSKWSRGCVRSKSLLMEVGMKNNVLLGASLGLVLGFIPALQGQQQTTVNGWGSDKQCAARGTTTAHRECAKKCIETGKKLDLVCDLAGKLSDVQTPESVYG